MKAKTIRKVLRKVFDEYLESITDPLVKNLVKENTMITGGSIVSLLMKEKVNDYDLYFRDYTTCLAVVNYYARMFGSKISVKVIDESKISIRVEDPSIFTQSPDSDEEPASTQADTGNKLFESFKPVYMSSNAITLSDGIQLVVRFYGEPEDIHANYDFVHCTCYWKSWDDELVLPPKALESMLTKELRYVGSKYPLCSIIRTRKFIARDWAINAGQYLKMAMQLNEMDLKDIKVLQDQLVGVDSAYFYQILALLEEKGQERIDLAYAMEIIDQIF